MSDLHLLKVKKGNQQRFGEIEFSVNLMKFITGYPLSTEEAIARYSFNLDHKVFGTYFIELKNEPKIIGIAVIKDKSVDEAEIGYMILDDFTGNGFATQVNKQLLDICKNQVPERDVTAYVDTRNTASIRVLEKCEMKRIDSLDDDGVTLLKYMHQI
jgi:RimJ/RimL family protein N-acetyltransferase